MLRGLTMKTISLESDRNTESIGRRYAIVPVKDLLDGMAQLAEYCLRLEPERRRSADGQGLGKVKTTYRQLTALHCELA